MITESFLYSRLAEQKELAHYALKERDRATADRHAVNYDYYNRMYKAASHAVSALNRMLTVLYILPRADVWNRAQVAKNRIDASVKFHELVSKM